MLDRLTLDQLRILIAAADSGSFSAAARRLGRVHSAVSQSVQSLEATLGVALFDRGERTPKLNEAGRALLLDARQIISSAENLRAHAESIASEVEPELTLAVDPLHVRVDRHNGGEYGGPRRDVAKREECRLSTSPGRRLAAVPSLAPEARDRQNSSKRTRGAPAGAKGKS